MRRFLLLCVMLLTLVVVPLGCSSGDPTPERDPNFTPTDNPSDIDHSKMGGPGGGGPAAPAKPATTP